MAIGPTFECTASLLQELPLLAASHNIRMEIVDAQESDALAVYCVFKGHCGRVEGHLNIRGQMPRMWLTFPRAYALNPLLWPLNFHLIRKVEKILVTNNAKRCDWGTYIQGYSDSE